MCLSVMMGREKEWYFPVIHKSCRIVSLCRTLQPVSFSPEQKVLLGSDHSLIREERERVSKGRASGVADLKRGQAQAILRT